MSQNPKLTKLENGMSNLNQLPVFVFVMFLRFTAPNFSYVSYIIHSKCAVFPWSCKSFWLFITCLLLLYKNFNGSLKCQDHFKKCLTPMDRARHRVRFLKKDHDSIFYNPKFLLHVLCSRFKMRCVPLITEKCLGTVPTEHSEMLKKKFCVQLKCQDHRTLWMKGVRHVEKIWLGETWKNQKDWKLAKGLTFRSLIWEIEDVEENQRRTL